MPSCFPPKPGKAPAFPVPSGTAAGASGATGASAYPLSGGFWNPWGGEGTREPQLSCQIKHHRAGLYVILRLRRAAQKLTQIHSKGLQKELGGK